LAFEDFPKFIPAIKRIRKLDANHLVALFACNRKEYEATLEITLRVPERRLAWRTISKGHAHDRLAAGVVSFASLSEQGTRVTLKLTSTFGGAVSNRVDKYLRNFKRLTEERRRKIDRRLIIEGPSYEGARITPRVAMQNPTHAQ
jgi:hypothetical protein